MTTEDWVFLPFAYAFVACIPFMSLWLAMSIKHRREMDEATRESFDMGKRTGHEIGFKRGLQAHIMATSELTNKEDELLTKFLVRHDFMLCYDSDINGFRIRRDGRYNPMKKVICVIDEHDLKVVSDEHEIKYTEPKILPLIQYEIDRLDFEIMVSKIDAESRRRDRI